MSFHANHHASIQTMGPGGIMFNTRSEAKWAYMFNLLKWAWKYRPKIENTDIYPSFIVTIDTKKYWVITKAAKAGASKLDLKYMKDAGWEGPYLILSGYMTVNKYCSEWIDIGMTGTKTIKPEPCVLYYSLDKTWICKRQQLAIKILPEGDTVVSTDINTTIGSAALVKRLWDKCNEKIKENLPKDQDIDREEYDDDDEEEPQETPKPTPSTKVEKTKSSQSSGTPTQPRKPSPSTGNNIPKKTTPQPKAKVSTPEVHEISEDESNSSESDEPTPSKKAKRKKSPFLPTKEELQEMLDESVKKNMGNIKGTQTPNINVTIVGEGAEYKSKKKSKKTKYEPKFKTPEDPPTGKTRPKRRDEESSSESSDPSEDSPVRPRKDKSTGDREGSTSGDPVTNTSGGGGDPTTFSKKSDQIPKETPKPTSKNNEPKPTSSKEDDSTDDLEKGWEKVDETKCVVCTEGKRSHMFMDCRHFICCERCSDILKICPFCKKPILQKIKVFT